MSTTIDAAPSRPARPLTNLISQALIYLALTAGALFVSLPFYWLIRTSLMVEGDHFTWPPIFWPNPIIWQNYVEIFQLPYAPMVTFIRNSLILVILAVTGELISTSLVGYSFARLRWWGRDLMFAVLVATLFLPSQVTIIPLFLLFKNLGWLDSLLPLIVPSWFGHAFFIFLMRQFVTAIPLELDDAARIDGCGVFRIYWHIIVPLSKPVLATVAIFAFQNKWNQFFEPLIYINKVDWMPLAVGVRMFRSAVATPGGGTTGNISWSHLLAATVVMVLPILIVFFTAQRAFIQGIVVTGVKG